ncbi:MAG: hypothetical protein WD688_16860 [Candidatus Binatia bacterium]
MRQVALLASDSSHPPLLTVFKESGLTQKYGFEVEIDMSVERKPQRWPIEPSGATAAGRLEKRL